jgi:hypothetical protein
METRSSKLWMCLPLLAACIALAATARAGDDTARFYGTWQATYAYNGQMITMLSVHDEGGYKNYVVAPAGNVPAGDGTFQAVNGKYATSAPAPNNAGTYHFIGANTVVCTNAAGQTLIWKRYNGSTPVAAASSPATPSPAPSPQPAAQPAPPTLAADPSLPPETNADIAAFGRKDYNTAWREFMIAAQNGDSEAQAGIGAMLLTHINPPGTGYWAQCEKWLLLSAKQGNTKGMTFLAKFYYTDGVNIAGGINPGVNNTPIPPALRAQAERRFA